MNKKWFAVAFMGAALTYGVGMYLLYGRVSLPMTLGFGVAFVLPGIVITWFRDRST